MNTKSDNELLHEISNKLTDLIGVIGINGKERPEQVKFLVGLGLTNADIARLTGIPKGTVDWIRAGKSKKQKE